MSERESFFSNPPFSWRIFHLTLEMRLFTIIFNIPWIIIVHLFISLHSSIAIWSLHSWSRKRDRILPSIRGHSHTSSLPPPPSPPSLSLHLSTSIHSFSDFILLLVLHPLTIKKDNLFIHAYHVILLFFFFYSRSIHHSFLDSPSVPLLIVMSQSEKLFPLFPSIEEYFRWEERMSESTVETLPIEEERRRERE